LPFLLDAKKSFLLMRFAIYGRRLESLKAREKQYKLRDWCRQFATPYSGIKCSLPESYDFLPSSEGDIRIGFQRLLPRMKSFAPDCPYIIGPIVRVGAPASDPVGVRLAVSPIRFFSPTAP
jgi:hypothetical protein